MKVIDSIVPLLLDSMLFYDAENMKPREKKKRKQNTTHLGLKIGQGGTLDPLADGVLVIGVNRGTKHLNRFLECSKEYISTGLLGAATTTYDSEGPIMSTHAFDGVRKEDIEKVLERFRGKIIQTPPIFSALKMDGKPLYEYARENIPLPRPIPTRECTVSIDLVDFRPASTTEGDGGHTFTWPKQHLSKDEKNVFRNLTEIVHKASEQAHDTKADPAVPDLTGEDVAEVSPKTGLRPATFTVRMTVTSGTYVRSIVHDIGLALGCGAHVVTLQRTRQGEFTLLEEESKAAGVDAEAKGEVAEEAPTDILAAPETKEAGSIVDGAPSGVEEIDEEAMMNAQNGEPSTTTVASTNAEDDEEAMMNLASTSTPAAPSTSASAKQPLAKPKTYSCIPWCTWERATAERYEMLKAEAQEKEEAIAGGMSNEDLNFQFSEKAVMRRRRERSLREWEVELLKRFVEVEVPKGHNSGKKYYDR